MRTAAVGKDEKLLSTMRKLLLDEFMAEKRQLERKLQKSREQRDCWKERAMFYRKQVLELKGVKACDQP
jgi:hypothetical protein